MDDATLVKAFHLWGRKRGIQTSTVHDAFVTNATDMLEARQALREIYARTLRKNVIEDTLEEMRKRGMPASEVEKFRNEAIEIGLIPVVGRSRIGGRLITKDDILTIEDILEIVPENFDSNRYWYGIGTFLLTMSWSIHDYSRVFAGQLFL